MFPAYLLYPLPIPANASKGMLNNAIASATRNIAVAIPKIASLVNFDLAILKVLEDKKIVTANNAIKGVIVVKVSLIN